MTGNEFKAIPIEVINRNKSKAFQAWSESETFAWLKFGREEGSLLAIPAMVKNEFIKRYEDAENKLYLQIERDKKAQFELTKAFESKLDVKEKAYQEALRENARLMNKLQNIHAPGK